MRINYSLTFKRGLTITRTSATSLEVTVGKSDKLQPRTIQFILKGGDTCQDITIVQTAAKEQPTPSAS